MSAALLVLLACQDAPSARLSFQPEQALLGQPVELVLEVTHAPDDPLAWTTLEPELDPSWVLFGSERALQQAPDDGRVVGRRVWRVASLEPGPRRAPEAFRTALEAAGVVLIGLEPVLEVSGVLAEGEDAPRPLRGFPDGLAGPAADARGFPWPLVAALSPLLFAALLLLRARRRGAAPLVAPREALASLRHGGARERTQAEVQQAHFALSALVRAVVDERVGGERPGQTDEEWLARAMASEALPRAAGDELQALVPRLAAVKYAGERPTPWAVDETFAAAERVLERLETAEVRA